MLHFRVTRGQGNAGFVPGRVVEDERRRRILEGRDLVDVEADLHLRSKTNSVLDDDSCIEKSASHRARHRQERILHRRRGNLKHAHG